MRIAISATGTDLSAQVDPRFGRCKSFVIFDPETLQHEAVDNSNAAAGGGAGIATAQMIVDKGVRAVLTGNCGPTGVAGTIQEAIEGYKAGRFLASSKPSVEAHHGLQKGAGI
jgi:predicted Fe-Mo cluster-binding NifX family protein